MVLYAGKGKVLCAGKGKVLCAGQGKLYFVQLQGRVLVTGQGKWYFVQVKGRCFVQVTKRILCAGKPTGTLYRSWTSLCAGKWKFALCT